MSLPKQIKNSQSGQILIIFLLILVVGLAIVLSIASRTVTDVRQTTTSDESNRAYYAAESGVENALKKISDGTIVPSVTPNTSATIGTINNNSSANVGVVALTVPATNVLIFPSPIAKDDVGQVNLIDNFNTLTSSGTGLSLLSSDGLTIYWEKYTGTPQSPKPAIEVSIISCIGGTNCGTNPVFHISKYTFDPDSGRVGGNGFCNTVVSGPGNYGPVTSSSGTSASYAYKVTVKFPTSGICTNDSVNTTDNPVLARIRLLYNSADVAVGGTSGTISGSCSTAWFENCKALPNQGSVVTSIGSTPSGVTRKLTVTQLYPALPAIFDYVLYNGSSSQALTKP